MEFNEGMIGKRIRETATGDEGVVTSKHPIDDKRVYVQWDGSGEYWIHIEDIEFIDRYTPSEITIDGVRYKLTKMD